MINEISGKRLIIGGFLVVVGVIAAVCMLVPSPVDAVTVVERDAVPLDENLSDQENNIYAPVDTIALARVSAPEGMQFGDSDSWIQGLYYYSITKQGFADIPFNYVVTWQGSVFETKGGGIDVAPLVNRAESDDLGSFALIAYFDNNQEVTNAGKSGLRELVSEMLSIYGLDRSAVVPVEVFMTEKKGDVQLSSLVVKDSTDQYWNGVVGNVRIEAPITAPAGDEVLLGSIEEVTYAESVDAGKNFLVTVEVKNEGVRPWYNSTENMVLVATSEPRGKESVFFVTDKWASFTRVVPANEEWVLPGEVGTFEFEMKTPLIPGEYSEKFELLMLPETWIGGTMFEVNFTVGKGDFELVEILDTDTGYLNVRECHATGCAEVGKVTPGEIHVKYGYEEGWYEIEFNDGERGWVYGKYVKEL